jgi:hypothetical protein
MHVLQTLTDQQWATWQRNGYLIVPGLLADLVEPIRTRFDALAQAGEPVPSFWEPDFDSDEPLKRYPRVMHPHRFDASSRQWMLDPRVGDVLADLLGEPAVACQAMYYFKPPQSPGQSLHQDNFYLAVQPGTCIAAWTAIDAASPDNGGLFVVPGSHRLDVQCPEAESFKAGKSNLVDPPAGMKAVPADMQPGDTLFFGGSLIHGSGRNRSASQWRRSFISHYMPASSTHVSDHYFPIYDFTGRAISYAAAGAGGPCGEAFANVGNSYGVDAVVH